MATTSIPNHHARMTKRYELEREQEALTKMLGALVGEVMSSGAQECLSRLIYNIDAAALRWIYLPIEQLARALRVLFTTTTTARRQSNGRS